MVETARWLHAERSEARLPGGLGHAPEAFVPAQKKPMHRHGRLSRDRCGQKKDSKDEQMDYPSDSPLPVKSSTWKNGCSFAKMRCSTSDNDMNFVPKPERA